MKLEGVVKIFWEKKEKTNIIFGHCALTRGENFQSTFDFHPSTPFSNTSRLSLSLEREKEFNFFRKTRRKTSVCLEPRSRLARLEPSRNCPEIVRNREMVERGATILLFLLSKSIPRGSGRSPEMDASGVSAQKACIM